MLFRHCNDNAAITSQHPNQGFSEGSYTFRFAQILRLISLDFAGHTHALAYVTQFQTETEDPGLQKRCTPHGSGTKVVIVRVEDITELCGVLHKTDGSQYFCANGTAIHHFDDSDPSSDG